MRDSGPTLRCIVGTGGLVQLHGPGDGVVSAKSATHPGAASYFDVHAKHGMAHRDPRSVAEIVRILREHLQEFDTASPLPVESVGD